MPKTLVTIGDSHTSAVFLDEFENNEENILKCRERSWSRKLFQIGNFEKEVNLSLSGSSNSRIVRVLMQWIKENYKENFQDPDLTIIISTTEPSRFEIAIDVTKVLYLDEIINVNFDKLSNNVLMRKVGSWDITNPSTVNRKYSEYVNLHYLYFNNDEYNFLYSYNQFVLLHYFLKSHGIRHYFFHGLTSPGMFKKDNLDFVDLPFIKFYKKNARHHEVSAFSTTGWLNDQGFKMGYELYPGHPTNCHHYDHDGNYALAEYIYEKIKEDL